MVCRLHSPGGSVLPLFFADLIGALETLSIQEVLQMVNPKTNHSGEPCIALYLPPLRGYLAAFFLSHKEEKLKKAAVAIGGAYNQRAFFLKSTSEAKKITKASGVTRASVLFIPRKQLENDILDRFEEMIDNLSGSRSTTENSSSQASNSHTSSSSHTQDQNSSHTYSSLDHSFFATEDSSSQASNSHTSSSSHTQDQNSSHISSSLDHSFFATEDSSSQASNSHTSSSSHTQDQNSSHTSSSLDLSSSHTPSHLSSHASPDLSLSPPLYEDVFSREMTRDLRARLRISTLTPESEEVLVSVRSEEPGAILKPVPINKEKCPKSVCGYKRDREGTPWVVCTRCEHHCRCVGMTKKKAQELPEWNCKDCCN